MPRANRRTGRTDVLLNAYVRYNEARQRRVLFRRGVAARIRRENLAEAPAGIDFDDSSSEGSSSSSDSSSDSEFSDTWSDLLGPNWRFVGDTVLDSLSLDTDTTSNSNDISEFMPELHSVGSGSSDSESEWGSV
ncbi:hypothetical protein DFH09DRAFT_1110906 [Mycena vulgaris]|nr:hypothetical protein DFH09DRAFT_1110906 [Mycena vulgaris]